MSDFETQKERCELEVSEAEKLFENSKTACEKIAASLETAKEEAKTMNKEASNVFEAAKKVYEAAKAKSKEHTASLTEKYEAAKKNKAQKKKNLSDMKKKLTALKKSMKAENKKTNKDVSDEGSCSQNTDTKPVDVDAQETTSKENIPEETSSNDGFSKSAHGIVKEAIEDLVEDTFGQETDQKKIQAKKAK
tara:strand:- start:47 stop:622 length:576 start_codon:yes stop_codon:yes gene_type:complete